MLRTMFSVFLALSFVVPALAATLTFSDVTDRYRDAPFSPAETAGISVLTHLGAVAGNPDGTFAPGRTLNRAEMLKVVLLAQTKWSLAEDAAEDCFPDVTAADWFSPYVCTAKRARIVEGYPDGRFRPEQSVNEAEALKMLGATFDVVAAAAGAHDSWYAPYRDAAVDAGVALPDTGSDVGRLLTRGQMARLTAAYRAYVTGELAVYRSFERGELDAKAGSVSSLPRSDATSSERALSREYGAESAQSVSSMTSASSAALSSAVSVASMAPMSPAVSRYLLPGERTALLMDGVFRPKDEDVLVRSVTVVMKRNIASVQEFLLVDALDRTLAVLAPRRNGTQTEQDTEWVGEPEDIAVLLRTGETTRLGVRARMRSDATAFVPGELIECKELKLRLEGGVSGNTQTWSAEDVHVPVHQAALGHMIDMENVLATSMSVQQGVRRQLASFRLTATGAALTLKSLTFALDARDVTLTRIMIGGSAPSQQAECGLSQQSGMVTVSCPIVHESVRTVTAAEPQVLSLYADLALQGSASAGFVQLRPAGHGSVGTMGALQWSDGSGSYSWMEADAILAAGPMVTVTR